MLFLAEEFHRNFLLEEIAAFEVDLVVVEAGGEGIGVLLYAFDHALCHGNAFCVNDEFFRAVTGEKIQHAGAGDHVDAAQRADHCGDAAFKSGLGIHEFRVRCAEIGVGRHAERLCNLSVGAIEHGGFDGAHGSCAFFHVKDRCRAAPNDGRAGVRELMDGDACEHFCRMLSDRSQHGDGSRRPRKRDGDNLRRDACTRESDQVARTKVRPNEWRRWADVEDGARFLAGGFGAACKEGEHIDHLLHGLICECAGDDGFLGI